jgi:hypothetical protein
MHIAHFGWKYFFLYNWQESALETFMVDECATRGSSFWWWVIHNFLQAGANFHRRHIEQLATCETHFHALVECTPALATILGRIERTRTCQSTMTTPKITWAADLIDPNFCLGWRMRVLSYGHVAPLVFDEWSAPWENPYSCILLAEYWLSTSRGGKSRCVDLGWSFSDSARSHIGDCGIWLQAAAGYLVHLRNTKIRDHMAIWDDI